MVKMAITVVYHLLAVIGAASTSGYALQATKRRRTTVPETTLESQENADNTPHVSDGVKKVVARARAAYRRIQEWNTLSVTCWYMRRAS